MTFLKRLRVWLYKYGKHHSQSLQTTKFHGFEFINEAQDKRILVEIINSENVSFYLVIIEEGGVFNFELLLCSGFKNRTVVPTYLMVDFKEEIIKSIRLPLLFASPCSRYELFWGNGLFSYYFTIDEILNIWG